MRALHLAVLMVVGCAAKETKLIDGRSMSFPAAQREPHRAPVGGSAPWDGEDADWNPVSPSPRLKMGHPSRPSVVGSFTVDYAALDVQEVRDEPPQSVSFQPGGQGFAEVPSLPLVGMVTAGGSTRFVSGIPGLFAPSGRTTLCPRQTPPRHVVVQGFVQSDWHMDALDFVNMEGSLEPGPCVASLRETKRARARAIVPGVLYAFRRPVAESKEELVVVGPAARWMSTSAEPKQQGKDPVGLFSVASVPLERGKSASLLMHILVYELEAFYAAHGTRPGWNFPSAHVLVFSIDVVWPEHSPVPEGYGSISQWLEPQDEF